MVDPQLCSAGPREVPVCLGRETQTGNRAAQPRANHVISIFYRYIRAAEIRCRPAVTRGVEDLQLGFLQDKFSVLLVPGFLSPYRSVLS